MAIFSIVFFKIFSSMLSVILGFLAGRISGIKKDGVAILLFYFVTPIVYFAIPASTNLKLGDLGITLITLILSSCLACFSYWFNSRIWSDLRPNILAFSAGTSNSSYLGVPIAVAIFDEHSLGIFILSSIGIACYETTVGFYFCSRGRTTLYQILLKMLRLPVLIASIMGCIVGLSDFQLPSFLDEFIVDMRSTLSVLGMLLIGLALSSITEFKFNYKFIASSLFSKFLLFPIAFNIFIILDRLFLGWYSSGYHEAMQLLCIMPLASSTILFSSLFELYAEEMATAAIVAMIISLLYIPIISSFALNIHI